MSAGLESHELPSDMEQKVGAHTTFLLQLALGSMAEPAFSVWAAMKDYAKCRGEGAAMKIDVIL